MTISRITVPARWIEPSGNERRRPAEFKLGKGACGRTVTSLDAQLSEGCLSIVQHHSDGPAKQFIYPIALLTGRVEADLV